MFMLSPRPVDDQRAQRRGLYATAAAHEQGAAQALFEVADMQADRGLRQVQRIGGSGAGFDLSPKPSLL